jgi:hypothetical protein
VTHLFKAFHNTVLKNLQKSSQEALKAEVDALAKVGHHELSFVSIVVSILQAIVRHESKAQELSNRLSSLSHSIIQVSETIQRCIRKEQEKADLRVVDLGLQVHKLGSDISRYVIAPFTIIQVCTDIYASCKEVFIFGSGIEAI